MRLPALRCLLLLCCLAGAARALEPGQPVEGWSLLSSEGMEIDFPRIAEGRPALLLLLGAQCGGCAGLFAELHGLRDDYAAQQLEVYVLGSGDAAALEALVGAGHDFVLVPDAAEVTARYGLAGAAALVLVDSLGKAQVVTAPLADRAWAAGVRAALDRLVAPQQGSR